MAVPKEFFDALDGLIYDRVVDGTSGPDSLSVPGEVPGLPIATATLFRSFQGDDIINDTGGQDRLMGGVGDDRLFGTIGNDRFFGGPGNDFILSHSILRAEGGTGNDVLQTVLFAVGSVNGLPDDEPTTFLNGGAGRDRFVVQISVDGDAYDATKPVHQNAVIEDFHRSQGDRIRLDAVNLGTESLTPRQTFNRLDTDDNGVLNNHDGQGRLGEVHWDGDSLHLRAGQAEVDVLQVAQLNAADFIFGG